MKKIIRIGAGFLLTFAGLIGIIFPVMPGWPLLIPGVLILSADIPLIARVLCWVEKRSPRARAIIERMGRRTPGTGGRSHCSPDDS